MDHELSLEERLARELGARMMERRMNKSPEEQIMEISWMISKEVLQGLVDEERIRSLLEMMEQKQILIAGLAKSDLNDGATPRDTIWTTGISTFIAPCYQSTIGDPMATVGTPFFDSSRAPFNPNTSLARLGVTTSDALKRVNPSYEYLSPSEGIQPALPVSLLEIIEVQTIFSPDGKNPRQKGIITEARLFDRLEQVVSSGPELGGRTYTSLNL